MLLLNLIYEICLLVYLVRNYSFILAQISEIYRLVSIPTIDKVVTTVYVFDIILGLATYLLAAYTLCSHKAFSYEWLVKLMLVILFSKLLMSYLNVLNLLVFIMKVALFVFTRFVQSVLATVLVIPQRMPRNDAFI
jgi:hypothetical protein